MIWTVSILVLVVGLLFFAVQFDTVQTFLAKRLTSYLSSELNTNVRIDAVSIRFVKSIVLKGFYVEDQHGDTLLYSDELSVSINSISTKDQKLSIGKLSLNKGDFNVIHYKGEKYDNLHFITDYFSSGDTSSSGKPWDVRVDDIALNEMSFKLDIEDDSALIYGVDFSHLHLKNINGLLKNFSTVNDSVFIDIKKLSFDEKSGFVLNNFSGDAKISDTEIRVKKLSIESPFTDIKTDLSFRFDSMASFDEFTTAVRWNSDFRMSKISFKDISYFAPDLEGLDKTLMLEGDFQGMVSNFKGRKVTLQWGDGSKFQGNISMKGLPYIDNTYMDILAEDISTNKKDVEWIQLPPFNEKHFVELPENFSSLGDVNFKGKFTGFFSDFVAYGNINTAIGSLRTDINLKNDIQRNTSYYSGRLAAVNFDAGKLADVSDLGRVTFSINVKGSGFRIDNINSKLEGKIDELEFKKYVYRNIDIDGEASKKLFSGSLTVKEPNVDLDFKGTIDYRGKLPEFKFTAAIGTAHLDTLNLFKTKEKSVLQTTVTTNFRGNKLDNIVGNILIENTNFISGNKLFHINSIAISDERTNGLRTFNIISDNLDAHLKGEFKLMRLGESFREILPRYLPHLVMPSKDYYNNQNFTYDIRIKNMNLFSELFFPAVYFSPNTTISGHFKSLENNVALDLSTSWIKFNEYSIDDFDLQVVSGSTSLNLDANAMRISKGEKDFILLPSVKADASNNRLNYLLRLADDDSTANRARLSGMMEFFTPKKFGFRVDSSMIVIDHDQWNLHRDNLVLIDSSTVTFNNLRFSKSEEFLQFEGVVGKRPGDRFALHLSGFRLEHLNRLLTPGSNKMGGVISGDMYVTDPFNQFQLESDLKISNLYFDKDTLGNASIVSRYSYNQKVVVSSVSVVKGTAKIVDINGNYFIGKENNSLEYDIKLNNVYLHLIEPYVSGVMHDVYGKVSADLTLRGSFKKPVLDGTIELNKTSLIVDYLNTRYSFTSTVKVRENEFLLDGVKLIDVNNNVGTLSGKVHHDYFKNFRFDAQLQATRFQILNTTINDNILYYGIANASGYASFYGPIDNMSMDISLSPDKGTKLNIPLNTLEDLSSSGFITFIDRTKDTSTNITRNLVNLSGIKLNMNLDMNRNAEIKIIFDEKIGDVITGTGTGSLRLDINTAGNFNMYGTYTIDKGDYLFTLQNLINKKFTVDPGGRITWAGDPYEAVVDLTAIYIVHTSSLYNILQDSTYKRRVPVELRLNLTNKLMNPTINYEIHVLGLDPTVESLLSSKLNSEQEISKQMFGLLMFNQFFPSSGAGTAGNRIDAGAGAGASATELLSNQVSNWLGQLNTGFDISVNYRARDTYTPDEWNVIITKSLLNDRLTLEGGVGVLGQQSYLQSNVVGDFQAEYKLSDDGRFRLKGFNRSNADDIIKYSQATYSQGIGLFYRKEYNRFWDLFKSKKKLVEENK